MVALKSALIFYWPTANCKKGALVVFSPTANSEKDAPPLFFRPQHFFRLRRKMLRTQKRVLRCAQPASRRLLRKTDVLTQRLLQRNSATANRCPGAAAFSCGAVGAVRYGFEARIKEEHKVS